MRYSGRAPLHPTSFASLPLNHLMADESSSTTAKKSKAKGGSKRKRVLGWFKPLKSAIASASQPNFIRAPVSSASGAHDPGPGNNAEIVEMSASGECITILALSTTAQPLSRRQCYLRSPRRSSGFTRRSSFYHLHPASKISFIKRSRSALFNRASR